MIYANPARHLDDYHYVRQQNRSGFVRSLSEATVDDEVSLCDVYRWRQAWSSTKDSSGWRDPAPYKVSRYSGVYQPGIALRHKPQVSPSRPEEWFIQSFNPRSSWIWTDSKPWAHLDESTFVPVLSQNNYSRLSTEVLLKLRKQKVNYGESLAEVNKTARHLVDTGSRLLKAAVAAKRGNFFEAARQLGISQPSVGRTSKDVAKRWLEYQYAWKPLMSDIEGTYKVLTDKAREFKPVVRVARMIEESIDYPFRLADLLSGEDRSGSSSATMKMVLYVTVNNDMLARAADVGLTSPLQVAWAIQPWSFLVDWFLPISNVLDAMSAPLGYSFKAGYASMKVKQTSTMKRINWPDFSPSGFDVVSKTPTTSSSTIEGFLREPFYSFPTPTPYFKSPFTSLERAGSLAALLRQLRK